MIRQDGRAGVDPPAAGRREGSAFTLVELLVVVAILSLLVSLLMPSLARARLLAKTTKCAAHLRNVGSAVAVYQSDNELSEPWLFTNGTADNPDETHSDLYPHLPGNPAWALAEKNDYVPTPEMFFCPHYPRHWEKDYAADAREAGRTPEGYNRIWGTYSWYWKHQTTAEAVAEAIHYYNPSVPAPPGRHMNNNGRIVGQFSRGLVLADTEPRWNWWEQDASYAHYNGLFIHGGVRLIADDGWDFAFWLWGPTGWRVF